MRAPLSLTLLLAILLGACGTSKEAPIPVRQIDQSGTLKVHPDLLAPAASSADKPVATIPRQ